MLTPAPTRPADGIVHKAAADTENISSSKESPPIFLRSGHACLPICRVSLEHPAITYAVTYAIIVCVTYYTHTITYAAQWRRKLFLDGDANIFQWPPDIMGPQERGPLPHFYNEAFTDIGVFLSPIRVNNSYSQ